MSLFLISSIIHPDFGVVAVGVDESGVWPLTQCCQAAASGIADYVGCKGCYQPVPDWFAFDAKDIDGLKATMSY